MSNYSFKNPQLLINHLSLFSPPSVWGQKSEAGCSHITAKLARTPQVDDQSLQVDTGTLKFTQPANYEGDKSHPSALNQSFTAGNSGSVKILVVKNRTNLGGLFVA